MFICSLYEEKDDICTPFVNYVLQSVKNIYIIVYLHVMAFSLTFNTKHFKK